VKEKNIEETKETKNIKKIAKKQREVIEVKEKISIDIKVNDRNKNNNNNHIERITFLKNLFENKNLLSHFKICPSKIGSNYKAIANYLGSYSKNDIEKLALIFLWISDNVAYDTDKYFGAKKGANNTKKYDSPSEEVFQEGKAMCGGYATLFKSMCIEVGIKAEEISGYAKGFGYKYGEPYKRNHAWNAVYYEGKWNLIESTWGSGSCNDQHKFVKEFKPFYFMAPPQIMINTHFPEDPKWQLLNTPMKFDEFGKNERKDYSNFYNTIYKEKIDYLSHDFPDIANEGNKLQIKIKLDKKFLINLNITEKKIKSLFLCLNSFQILNTIIMGLLPLICFLILTEIIPLIYIIEIKILPKIHLTIYLNITLMLKKQTNWRQMKAFLLRCMMK